MKKTQEDFQPVSEKFNVLGKKLNNLCRSLRAKLQPPAPGPQPPYL
jgi:hypothetical protein